VGIRGFSPQAANPHMLLDDNNNPMVAYQDVANGSNLSVQRFQNFFIDTTNVDTMVHIIDHATKNIFAHVYPNPNKGVFVLDYKNLNQIEIYDAQGRLVAVEELNVLGAKEISTDLISGVYFLKLIGDDGFEVLRIRVE